MKSLGVFKDHNDGSIKCVFDTNGENTIIEMTLLMNREDTDVVCVPTHHFCNLGCKMCHLTNNSLNKCSKKIEVNDFMFALGLTICKQDKNNRLKETGYSSYDLICGERRTNKKKLLLSFMGVGEPTLNIELIREINKRINHIKRFLQYDEVGFALATMMPNKNIEELTRVVNEENIPLKIHFSLHTPIDKTRNKLIPASKNSVKECFDYLKEYQNIISKNETIMKNYGKCHKTNDLVEIHYTLIKDVNDTKEDLDTIISFLNKYGFTIKFIRFNPKDDMFISEKEKEWVETIKNKTNSRVKTYSPPGKNIGSSCGEFTKHYYHEEIESEKDRQEFLEWKRKYEIFD